MHCIIRSIYCNFLAITYLIFFARMAFENWRSTWLEFEHSRSKKDKWSGSVFFASPFHNSKNNLNKELTCFTCKQMTSFEFPTTYLYEDWQNSNHEIINLILNWGKENISPWMLYEEFTEGLAGLHAVSEAELVSLKTKWKKAFTVKAMLGMVKSYLSPNLKTNRPQALHAC